MNVAADFRGAVPFDHCVVENFFRTDIALELAKEFRDFEAPIWYQYNNPIEIKNVSNNRNCFGALTCRMLNVLNSDVDVRGKALYAPTREQENGQDILGLLRKRAEVNTAAKVYK